MPFARSTRPYSGFLESGKTSFIASVLQDPGFTRDENTLIIQCEEGETETNTSSASWPW